MRASRFPDVRSSSALSPRTRLFVMGESGHWRNIYGLTAGILVSDVLSRVASSCVAKGLRCRPACRLYCFAKRASWFLSRRIRLLGL
jgi:hypothetical protein